MKAFAAGVAAVLLVQAWRRRPHGERFWDFVSGIGIDLLRPGLFGKGTSWL